MPDAGITGCSAITAWSFVGKDPLNRIAEAIETGMPVDVDGREARKSVAIIEAVYRSAAAKTQFFPD